MMDVSITTRDPIHLAAIRHTGPYHQIGNAFERVMALAGPRGLFGPDTRLIGIYHDDPGQVPADQLRADACISAPETFTGDDSLRAEDLAGGEYAVAVHKGPYDKLADAWKWLIGEWLPASGRSPAPQPCYEVYLNDPRSTPPEELLTEICVPLTAQK